MNRQPSLDGLRGIAIVAVVASHAYPQIFPGGWFGVDLFFVLSGFLITSLLRDELQAGGIGFGRFYMRRFLRLMPALACLLLVMLARAPFTAHPGAVVQAVAWSGSYLMNWNMAFDLGPEDVLGHTWSLAVEEQFYIFWPLALVAISNRRPKVWLAAGIATVFAWRCILVLNGASAERVYFAFDTRADSLLIGCFVALLSVDVLAASWVRKTAFIPISALAIALFTLSPNKLLATIGLSLIALATAWIMVAAMQHGILRAALSAKPMVYVGRVSYSWYLWHSVILLLGAPYFNVTGGNIILVCAAFGVAAASYHYVELPFLRLKAQFGPKSVGGDRAAPEDATKLRPQADAIRVR